MNYRTRTYIAADWENDYDAVDELRKWNDSDHWSLSFTDAHDLCQSKDTSLNCTIKHSLADRMNHSKTFILIVGENTINLRSGSCQYCQYRGTWQILCRKAYYVDNRSYIEYECEKAVNDELKIVVIYKSRLVNKNKCPEVLRGIGMHIPGYKNNGDWDYEAIKKALE